MNDIDIDQAKNAMTGLLFLAMNQPEARNAGSFKYVSADWIGSPGWFFWPKSRPGVFLLKLSRAVVSAPANHTSHEYLLHYYPSLNETLFNHFSCVEQMIRVSDFFGKQGVQFSTECPHCDCADANFKDLTEGKGIPSPQTRHLLSNELFVVGKIRLIWQNGDLLRIESTAPVRDQTWAEKPVEIAAQGGTVRLLEAGSLDRDLPAWAITDCFTKELIRFLPLRILHSSSMSSDQPDPVSCYIVRETRCRTTGAPAELETEKMPAKGAQIC